MFPCCFCLLFSLTVNKNKETHRMVFFLFYNFRGFGFMNNSHTCLLFCCQSSGKGRSEIWADVPRERGSRCPRIGSVMGFDI